jgi:hypothetical protein
VSQIAKANHGPRAVGLNVTDERVEMLVNLLRRERNPAPAKEEMIAERNDSPSRLLVTFQRLHDGRM